jgi:hypothetical protein
LQITDRLEFVAMVSPYTGYDIDPKFPVAFGDSINGMVVQNEWRDGFGGFRLVPVCFMHRQRRVGVRGYVKIQRLLMMKLVPESGFWR